MNDLADSGTSIGISDRSITSVAAGVTVQRPEKLLAPTHPTIVVVSGVLGSGKTSLVEHLVLNVQLSPQEKGAIFNERYERLAKTDAARIKEIQTVTVGGCACCISKFDIERNASEMLSKGRKLVIVEQSGASDGAELVRSLRNKFGAGANVRLITLVDSEHIDVPPAIINPAIVAADVVVETHVPFNADSSRRSKAADLVHSLRDESPDLRQTTAGYLSAKVWQKLLRSQNDRLSSLVPLNGEEKRARERYRDSLVTTPLLIFPGISKAQLIEAVSNSSVIINRAKGFIPDPTDPSGKVIEVQYELKDSGKGAIAFGEPIPKSSPNSRAILNLMSYSGAPEIANFVKIGLPDLSIDSIKYYLGLYPGADQLLSLAKSDSGVPIRSDGDALALQAFGLTQFANQLPTQAAKDEFSRAFLPLLFGYAGWRVEVINALKKEGAAPRFEYSARCVAAGHSLAWSVIKFGKFLQTGNPPPLPKIISAKPGEFMLEALSSLTENSLAERPLVTPALINDLPAVAQYAIQHEGVSRDKIKGLLKQFERNMTGVLQGSLGTHWNATREKIGS